MDQLKKWLARWKNLAPADAGLKMAAQEAIKEITGLAVETKNIKIAHHTVYLDLKPAWKTEIFLHRQKILELLQQKIGPHAPKKII
jgi:hypothetical protein